MDGIGKGNKNGLIRRWRSAAAKISNNIVQTDKIPTKMIKERNFIVHNPDNGRIKEKELSGIVSYTNGSLLNNKTGCGVHTVFDKRVIYNGNFYLGNTATVFQAEVTAIRKSAQMLQNSEWKSKIITFFSDCQSQLGCTEEINSEL